VFRRRPADNPIDWLAHQLLTLAADSQRLSLRIIPSADGENPALEATDSVHVVTTEDPSPLRLFRTLLARFAKMAVEENGTEFNPYGGKLHFERSGPGGPVRLDVEFANTTQVQSLAIVRSGAIP
jgi:hypothetical protein